MTLVEHNLRQQERAQERALAMLRLRDRGETLQSIADIYGVSRQRVHQILDRAESRGHVDATIEDHLAEELPEQAADTAECAGAAAVGGRHA